MALYSYIVVFLLIFILLCFIWYVTNYNTSQNTQYNDLYYFNKYVINYDDKNIHNHICRYIYDRDNIHNNINNANLNKYLNFINTYLAKQKNYIIESIIRESIKTLKKYDSYDMNLRSFYNWVITPIYFAYFLDKNYTIEILRANTNNGNTYYLIRVLRIFFLENNL
jgi:4-amino-4-deoxy-L-arabinose transferase-like glycosyltransferase